MRTIKNKDNICMIFKPVDYRTIDEKTGASSLQICMEYRNMHRDT